MPSGWFDETSDDSYGMYACIYELWKNCCGRTDGTGKSKVPQEGLAALKIIIQVQSNYDFSILINLACLCNVSVALSLGLMFHTIPEISVMPESHKHWKMSLKILLSWKVT